MITSIIFLDVYTDIYKVRGYITFPYPGWINTIVNSVIHNADPSIDVKRSQKQRIEFRKFVLCILLQIKLILRFVIGYIIIVFNPVGKTTFLK